MGIFLLCSCLWMHFITFLYNIVTAYRSIFRNFALVNKSLADGHALQQRHNNYKKYKTTMKKTFSVSGMKCSHCAANVENALKAVKGVVSAEAHLEDKTVTVEFDGQQTSEADLKAAVDATGRYELTD